VQSSFIHAFNFSKDWTLTRRWRRVLLSLRERIEVRAKGAEACVDTRRTFCLHAAVKWLALLLLVGVQCSCATRENWRDLYRPDPLGGYGGSQRMRMTTSTSSRSTPAISTPAEPEEPSPASKPEFRY
jgi:hypothetical protein